MEIVGTALQNGITVLEAGPEGGDAALCDAILEYYNKQQPIGKSPGIVPIPCQDVSSVGDI